MATSPAASLPRVHYSVDTVDATDTTESLPKALISMGLPREY